MEIGVAEAMNRWTICHVTESEEPGGAETVVLSVAEEYARRGLDQKIVLMKDGWLASELRTRGFAPAIMPSHTSFDLRWIISFSRFLRTFSIDVVHSHLLDASFYASLAARLAGVPCIVTEHGDVTMSSKQSWKHTVKLVATQLCADKVVAVSERTRSALLRRARIGERRTTVVYNGIRAAEYSRRPSSSLRPPLGIPSGAKVIGTVGALTEVKGQVVLLRAHARLPRDTWCLIVGDGPLRPQLEMVASELGTRDRVILTGFRRDIPSILHTFDVFCLPSLSEGLPLVLIEALASGLEVVASDVGGIGEAVNRAGRGSLVRPNDVAELESALRLALSKSPVATPFPREFELDEMIAAYLHLYDEVIATRGPTDKRVWNHDDSRMDTTKTPRRDSPYRR